MESSISKRSWIEVGTIIFGFLESLGRDFYEGRTNISLPNLIPIIFGLQDLL